MKAAFLVAGFLCCLIGAQFLIVDKIVLHEGAFPPEDPEVQFYEIDDTAQRHIDLPDSGGFVLVAIGVIALLYSMALRRNRDKM